MASRPGFHPARHTPTSPAAAASIGFHPARHTPTSPAVAASIGFHPTRHTPTSPAAAASIGFHPGRNTPTSPAAAASIGFHPGRNTPSSPAAAASIGSAHCDNILRNFRQEEVVYALMTQLREKENELTLISEQRQVALTQQHLAEQASVQLNSGIGLHNKALAEKDTKIAVLEQELKLAREKKGNESSIAEANIKHLTETNAECKRVLHERDDELAQLRPILRELEAKVNEFIRRGDVKKNEKLEEELVKIKGEIDITKEQQLATNSTVEELGKKIKGKEWMIKSLQEESDDQRSRENHLLAHIKKLNDKIVTYETKFKGKGVDVPMLLAKLKDYEVRTKNLQGEIRRLTNKKLNELVVRAASPAVSAPVPLQAQDEHLKNTTTAAPVPLQAQDEHLKNTTTAITRSESKDEADNESEAGESYSFLLVNSEQDDEFTIEEATLASLASNGSDIFDGFSPKSTQDEGVLSEFLTDVKVGIEDMQTEGFCCAITPRPYHMNSPPSYGSPTSYQSPRSPMNSRQSYGSPTSYQSPRSSSNKNSSHRESAP